MSSEEPRPNLFGTLFVLGIVVLMFVLMHTFISSSIDSVMTDVEECDEVYERPDDFRPLDGTVEEKYERCVKFVEEDSQLMIEDMENMRNFLYVLPLIGVSIFLLQLILLFRSGGSGGGDPHDRTHYDPDWKGYGK